MVPFLRTMPAAMSDKKVRNFLDSHVVDLEPPLQGFNWEQFMGKAKSFFKRNFLQFVVFLSGGLAIFHYTKILSCIGNVYEKL